MTDRKNPQDVLAFALVHNSLTAAEYLVAMASFHAGHSLPSDHARELMVEVDKLRDAVREVRDKASKLRDQAEGYDV
jgi:hypothetical protein